MRSNSPPFSLLSASQQQLFIQNNRRRLFLIHCCYCSLLTTSRELHSLRINFPYFVQKFYSTLAAFFRGFEPAQKGKGALPLSIAELSIPIWVVPCSMGIEKIFTTFGAENRQKFFHIGRRFEVKISADFLIKITLQIGFIFHHFMDASAVASKFKFHSFFKEFFEFSQTVVFALEFLYLLCDSFGFRHRKFLLHYALNVRGYSQSHKMGIIPPCFWVAILIVFNWETKEKCLIINKKFDNIDLATGNQDFLCYYLTEWVLPTPIPFLICSFANRFDDELIFHSL